MEGKEISGLNEEADLFDIIAHHVTSGQYKDGWDEDKWEQQMEEHPLFMTKAPEGELPPLVEAIAQIKYDEESDNLIELANNYKDDGNENFRLKKYRWAVDCYRKALECKVKDNQLNSILFNNRASANFHLENYRSSMLDALQAIKLNPDNKKATLRAVECMMKLEKYQFCVDFCSKSKFSSELTSYKTKALESLKRIERDERKAKAEERKIKLQQEEIKLAVEKRKINYSGSLFIASHPAAEGHHVHLNDQGELIWPVLFVYPEFGQSDFIESFNENDSFDQHFSAMFPLNEDHPNWDVDRKYRPDNLKVAFQDARSGQIYPFKLTRKLKSILTDPKFIIISAIPTFIVVSNDKSFQS
ncbi:tetratricopeptide repeat protein 4-like [Panonychus citri]|uniref:tetratricopeptide repeat protein 4-like n=1 Tax=Panonychus citri TaxID=50023 RepID=UPI002307501A|nr:tetratricopeptide repeat protein 4-like [Panonychus citri]